MVSVRVRWRGGTADEAGCKRVAWALSQTSSSIIKGIRRHFLGRAIITTTLRCAAGPASRTIKMCSSGWWLSQFRTSPLHFYRAWAQRRVR